MTKPKRHLPGQVVFITRRTTQRQFFLRPGPDTRNIMGYFYGKYANEAHEVAHGASTMSTHFHAGQSDRRGMRTDFMRPFFSQTGRKINLLHNRRENMWSSEEPGDMVLLDLDKIVEELLYIWLQPVAAGCVDEVEDWTGFMILPRHWGKPMRFKRPKFCGPTMPEEVIFTPMPPPGFDHLPLDQVIAYFESLIAREEERYRKKRKRKVLGIDYCEAISPFHTPKTDAPMRTLNPRFSGTNIRRLGKALEKHRELIAEHRQALDAFRGGDRTAVFPSGTIQLVHLAGVSTHPLERDDPHLTDVRWTDGVQHSWDVFLRSHP